MASKSTKSAEHLFSIELKSVDHLKSIALANQFEDNFLIEGFLGELEGLCFTDGLMLEVHGSKGTLRMDLSMKELKRLLPKGSVSVKKTKKQTTE
jgi:hypothetical protein